MHLNKSEGNRLLNELEIGNVMLKRKCMLFISWEQVPMNPAKTPGYSWHLAKKQCWRTKPVKSPQTFWFCTD